MNQMNKENPKSQSAISQLVRGDGSHDMFLGVRGEGPNDTQDTAESDPQEVNMRAFVAIPVPDDIKQYARMMRNELGRARPDIKWVEYQNYHLTLKFLGEIEYKMLPELKKNLSMAGDSSPVFNLSAGGIGFFPNQTRPRVMWMGIKGEMEKAVFLGDRVDAYLGALGFEAEKDHRFHLTLGRIRSEAGLKEMRSILDKMPGKDNLRSFKIEHFHLMESTLSSAGPQYSILETFTLNG